MKKLFLILITLVLSTSAWAQSQRSTLKGKTKDGKSLTVQYYHGTVEDLIESVKYQVVDELQAEIKNLKANVRDLQNRLDAANKEVKQLKNQLGQSTSNQDDMAALNQQIAEKNEEIDQLNSQLDVLLEELNQVQEENSRLQARLDSIIEEQASRRWVQAVPAKTPVIGVEGGLGAVVLRAGDNNVWANDLTMGGHVAVYYGTARLTESFPISFEAGVGFRRFSMATHLSQYECRDQGYIDTDGDAFEAIYGFNGLSERLSVNYLDIPVRICIGQPIKEQVSVYAKLGVTPSLNIGTPAIEGSGLYSVKGYYPAWNVTLEDIAELGFVSNKDFYQQNEVVTDIKKFNLWANLAVGAYMPFKNAPVILNVGFKLDYPILQLGETSFKGTGMIPHQWHTGLLQKGGKVLIPSLELGLVYTIK